MAPKETRWVYPLFADEWSLTAWGVENLSLTVKLALSVAVAIAVGALITRFVDATFGLAAGLAAFAGMVYLLVFKKVDNADPF